MQVTDSVTATPVCMLLSCRPVDMLDYSKPLPRVMPSFYLQSTMLKAAAALLPHLPIQEPACCLQAKGPTGAGKEPCHAGQLTCPDGLQQQQVPLFSNI